MIKKIILLGVVFVLSAGVSSVFAIPTFQTYIEGAAAGTIGEDEDTWFSYANPFTLKIVGAYGPKTTSITNVTLLISVPEGETGAISFSTLDEEPSLLTLKPSTGVINPTANSGIDILTNIVGDDGYAVKEFFPSGTNFDNHYPVKSDISDFLIFNLFSFDDSESNLTNYDADEGIESTSARGEEKEYVVSYSGFSWLHFDVYGLVTNGCDCSKKGGCSPVWKSNPGSHDSTAVIPEPASLFLLGSGLLGLFGMKRRRG